MRKKGVIYTSLKELMSDCAWWMVAAGDWRGDPAAAVVMWGGGGAPPTWCGGDEKAGELCC